MEWSRGFDERPGAGLRELIKAFRSLLGFGLTRCRRAPFIVGLAAGFSTKIGPERAGASSARKYARG